ncbi:cation-transporting P-type ATPase [Clostridium sp. DMHC 10]|uniref:cation-transporting P-type ATPase n=1 Tax=Clostridium sp. DMHC 10 TaxID=747377 RepID=UPI00069FB3FD|nr:cation-transporting P-type ATPase [Clostridium sp. DMHC 10]
MEKCTHVMINGTEREITDDIINKIKLADIQMSSDSLHVVAFAYRNFNYRPSEDENIESNLVFAGLVGFENPIKDDFKYTLERCRNDGIKPIIFTEDSKLTALSIGNKTRILSEGNSVISGIELENILNDEFERHVEKIGMYSRVSNKNKENIVKTLKKFGYNIIISGSKLTELPTLKEANLFISSGRTCNKIVKKLSDIFFEENDFGKILKIIENSKRLIISIRDMIKNIILGDICITLMLLIFSMQNKNMPFDIYAIIWMIFICFNLNGIAILTNYTNVSVEYDYEVEKERLWNINIFSVLLSSIFILMISFSGYYFLSDYKHITNADNFILYSIIYASIIYVLINNFKNNLHFYIVIIANIAIQSLILFTGAGKAIFSIDILSLYELEVLGVVLLAEAILLGIKRTFS